MGGKYQSDSYPFTGTHKALIERWIQGTIDKKGWEEYLDLHVDEICRLGKYNSRGKHKKYWIPLAISLVYHANKFLQEINKVDIIGIVEMPLHTNEQARMGFPFHQLEDIKHAFNVTPPSLSVYPKWCTELANVYQDANSLGTFFVDHKQFDMLSYEVFLKKDYVQHMRVISLVPANHNIKLSK